MVKRKMCDQTKEIFQTIDRKLLITHHYFQLYEQVYGSEEVIRVVNDSANGFFAMNQSIFIDNLILSIVRFLDPAKMGGNENLSLMKLLKLIENDANSSPKLVQRLSELLKDLQNIIKPLRKHRNKRIAHFDLELVKNGSASLPDIEDKLYKAIGYLDKFMNEIHLHYKTTQHDYEIQLPIESDGRALIHQLIKGKAYQKLEDEEKIEKDYWINVYSNLP